MTARRVFGAALGLKHCRRARAVFGSNQRFRNAKNGCRVDVRPCNAPQCTLWFLEAFMSRSSGVLLHVTSLSNKYGIGDLGPSALAFGHHSLFHYSESDSTGKDSAGHGIIS